MKRVGFVFKIKKEGIDEYKKHHKIELICKKHGSFKKLISSHLIGSGCPLCSKEDRLKNVLKYYKI